MNRSRLVLSLFFCASLTAFAGCGGGDGVPRAVVSGSVTFQQVPVEDGQIRYIPVEGTPGPTSVSRIRQGQYVCDHNGGVPVGTHRVEILVWDPNVPPPKGPGEAARPQWAPVKYNRNSELTATIDATGFVTKDFEL